MYTEEPEQSKHIAEYYYILTKHKWLIVAVFVVAVDKVDGWFHGNLPNHVIAARAIEDGNARRAHHAMERVLGFTQTRLASLKAAAGHRAGRAKAPRVRSQI